MAGQPILVTGSHRSGTTWVGRMLALARDVGYVHEPLNPRRNPNWNGHRVPYWFVYITPANESYYAPVLRRVLDFRYPLRDNLPRLRGPKEVATLAVDLRDAAAARLRRARPLLKDPFALFSSEWIADRFDARMIVMVRHPAAFAGSIKRLNWRFKFRSWLAQPRLLEDFLAPYEADMRRCSTDATDVIDEAIVMWNVLHHVVRTFRQRHPEWAFVRHEDLAADPLAGFRNLYEHAGVAWTSDAVKRIGRFSSSQNPKEVPTWRHQSVRRDSRAASASWRRRLGADEIARIRVGVEEVASDFYSEDDW